MVEVLTVLRKMEQPLHKIFALLQRVFAMVTVKLTGNAIRFNMLIKIEIKDMRDSAWTLHR